MNFGEESYEEVVRRMNSSNVTFTWKKLYEVIFYFCFTIQEFGVIWGINACLFYETNACLPSRMHRFLFRDLGLNKLWQ